MDLIARGPHLITVVTPKVRTNRYGSEHRDYGDAATRRWARGWIQQKTTTDLDEAERPAGHRTDLVFYTHAHVGPLERVEYDGRIFEIDGDVYAVSSPRGRHHHRIRLRLVEG